MGGVGASLNEEVSRTDNLTGNLKDRVLYLGSRAISEKARNSRALRCTDVDRDCRYGIRRDVGFGQGLETELGLRHG